MSFKIVEFSKTKDVAVIHRKWLEGESVCYWPPFWKNRTKLQKSIKNGEIPDKSTWGTYDIRILHACGNDISKNYILLFKILLEVIGAM